MAPFDVEAEAELLSLRLSGQTGEVWMGVGIKQALMVFAERVRQQAEGATKREAIIGSRGWSDAAAVREHVQSLPADAVVVTGGWWRFGAIHPTRGVDFLASDEAAKCGLTVCLVAGSPTRGKLAGIIRNPVVVDIAQRVKAFWDGASPGTKRTMDLARKAGKLTR